MKCKWMKCTCLKDGLKDAAEKGKEKAEALAAEYREGNITGRELVLSGIVLFLAGIVLGMLFSPRKTTMVGCNNGNENISEYAWDEDDEE